MLIAGLGQVVTEGKRDAESGEEVLRDLHHLSGLVAVRAAHGRSSAFVTGNGLEASTLPLPVLNRGNGQAIPRSAVQRDETVRVREGQRLEEHGVEDAEDGGGRADAERERKDGGGGEAGAVTELAECVTKRLEHALGLC